MKRKRKTISASKFKHFLLTAGVRTIERMRVPMAKAGLIHDMPFVFCSKVEAYKRGRHGHMIDLTIAVLVREGPEDDWEVFKNVFIISLNVHKTYWLTDTASDFAEQEEKKMLEAGIPSEQIHSLLKDHWIKHGPETFAAFTYLDSLDKCLNGREVITGRKVWKEMQKDYNKHLGEWENIIMYYKALTTPG